MRSYLPSRFSQKVALTLRVRSAAAKWAVQTNAAYITRRACEFLPKGVGSLFLATSNRSSIEVDNPWPEKDSRPRHAYITRSVMATLLIVGLSVRSARAENVDLSTVPSRSTVQLTIYNS